MRLIYTITGVFLVGATVFTFIEKEKSKSSAPALPNTGTFQVPPAFAQTLNPKHGQPGHRCDLPVGAPPNSAQKPVVNLATQSLNTFGQAVTASAKTNPALAASAQTLNPKHGQPGHRCDLPVGAPLNSAQKPVVNLATQSLNTVSEAATASAKTNAALAGSVQTLNPKHGQPGHRCDLPVGAPL
jgi:hypothetical protein